ncbi:PepSY domain-containing protein, partial [Methylomonas sp. SURF-2]
MKTLNWLLYEVHRWLGVVLAVFMLVWFASGISIMYSTPMTQTRTQQLLHAEALAPEPGWLSVGEAWERSAGQREASAAAFKA